MEHQRCLCLTSRKPVALRESYYTLHQTAHILGYRFTAILNLVKRKRIRSERMGKTIFISREEILDWAEKNKIFIREPFKPLNY